MCSQTGEDRTVETQLVELLDFDKFNLIKVLLKNRLKIVWCTRRERAQGDDERRRIEVMLAAHFCCRYFQRGLILQFLRASLHSLGG